MAYKVVHEKVGSSDIFYIYCRKFIIWRYIGFKPSLALCKRLILEKGCLEFTYVEKA